jgi:hypothetical protein
MEGTRLFCRACGKQIEEDSRFCRFCGTSQADGPTAAAANPAPRAGNRFERRVRQVFPRHHLQDEITHYLLIAAMVIGVVGFLIALFPPLGGGIYGLAWLLFAIVLLLFVMHRDATIGRVLASRPADPNTLRYHAARGAQPAQPSAPAPEGRAAAAKEPGTQK